MDRSAMTFDIRALLKQAEAETYALHDAHVNPRFAKVLRTIGFDRCYVRGEGPYLWDDKGRRYIDMLSGYGVFNFGRNHPVIKQAMIDFIESEAPSLVQMEAPPLSGLLARELKKRMPNEMDIVYFTNSGTEGNETAIKFARCATGKSALIYASRGFHGLSTGSLAVNGGPIFKEGFGPLLDSRSVPFNDLAALEAQLMKGDVAAFMVEPVQGKGVNVPAAGYLAEAARLCRKYGALFVADEVQCGMGRTGKFLALEHDGDVDPDIVILSKALSGGYVPVGAVLTKKWIYDKVFSSLERAVVHSSTFGQGQLAMAAGLASLHVLDEFKLMENARAMADKIGQGLLAMKERYEFIHDVRWRGLMIAIEFGPPKSMALKTAWAMTHRMDENLFPQAVTIPLMDDHGIITQVAGHNLDVIKLLPPLVIDEADSTRFLEAFEQVMKKLHRFPGPVWEVLAKLGKLALSKRAS
jgi:acetylornithine/succinyldiaminopimelate/putrescine aminotransferase